METRNPHRSVRFSRDWILDHDPADRQLLDAVTMGDDHLVLSLLLNGARPDARDRMGNTALLLAVLNGSYKVCHLLLGHGADPNGVQKWKDENGRTTIGRYTPLMHAAELGRADLTRLLLEYHADPNLAHPHYGFTPLMLAAGHQYDDVVEALVAGGADVHACDRNGESALKYARCECFAGSTVHALKHAGATTLF